MAFGLGQDFAATSRCCYWMTFTLLDLLPGLLSKRCVNLGFKCMDWLR